MKCAGCNQERPNGRMKECGHCRKSFCTVTTPGSTCNWIHKDGVKQERKRKADFATIAEIDSLQKTFRDSTPPFRYGLTYFED